MNRLTFWTPQGFPKPSRIGTPTSLLGRTKSSVDKLMTKLLVQREAFNRYSEEYFKGEFQTGVALALSQLGQDVSDQKLDSLEAYVSPPLFKIISKNVESLSKVGRPVLRFNDIEVGSHSLWVRFGPPVSSFNPKYRHWDEDVVGTFYNVDHQLFLKKDALEFVLDENAYEERPVESFAQAVAKGRTLKARVNVSATVLSGFIEPPASPDDKETLHIEEDGPRDFCIELESFSLSIPKPGQSNFDAWTISDLDNLLASKL